MIELYGFLTVFFLQVVTMSLVFPARMSRYARAQAARFPAERLAQLYPDVDLDAVQERFLTRFRAVNAIFAVVGLALLGAFLASLQDPGWNAKQVIIACSVYFMLQLSPLGYLAWFGVRFKQVYTRFWQETKRKATLERRGLFDFVSPFVVIFAVAGYLLFVGHVLATQTKPEPGINLIVVLTLSYLLQAFVIFKALYGKKAHAFETHADRVHRIGLSVRVNLYAGILSTAFFAFVYTVDRLDMHQWVPLAMSVCLLITTLLCLKSLTGPPRDPGIAELESRPVS